eukprot:964737-Pleurochrysis_carterae.AAC.1
MEPTAPAVPTQSSAPPNASTHAHRHVSTPPHRRRRCRPLARMNRSVGIMSVSGAEVREPMRETRSEKKGMRFAISHVDRVTTEVSKVQRRRGRGSSARERAAQ